jgi:hypothetical protein
MTKVAGYAKEAADLNAASSIIGGITGAGSKFITAGTTGIPGFSSGYMSQPGALTA